MCFHKAADGCNLACHWRSKDESEVAQPIGIGPSFCSLDARYGPCCHVAAFSSSSALSLRRFAAAAAARLCAKLCSGVVLRTRGTPTLLQLVVHLHCAKDFGIFFHSFRASGREFRPCRTQLLPCAKIGPETPVSSVRARATARPEKNWIKLCASNTSALANVWLSCSTVGALLVATERRKIATLHGIFTADDGLMSRLNTWHGQSRGLLLICGP